MRIILILSVMLIAPFVVAQNYTVQDMTLQLDENGQATLVPKDVLVNTTGTVWAISGVGSLVLQFDYDQEAQTLDFIEQVDEECQGFGYYFSNDLNPINKQEYLSGGIIDCCEIFSPFVNDINCDLSQSKSSIEGIYNECNFYFNPPLLFTFDKDGVLYETTYGTEHEFGTFDPHSNIRIPLMNSVFDPNDSGLTYDFENHRLIGTTRNISNNLAFVAIDIETFVLEVLFETTPPGNCFANAIEYIGNDMMLVGSFSNSCPEIYVINLVTEEITVLANDYHITDFLFIEDEIPDATLSQSQFNCSDVGEQIVDVTVLENGNPVNYQATVNVVPDFSVRDCKVFRRLLTPDPNGSDDAVIEDYTDSINIVSSCSSSFTVTQDPSPGTLVPHEELVTITITVTDEFGNTALCQTIGCSDSVLSVEDIALENNFVVSPNPTNELITIENKNSIPLSSIEVFDIHGRILQSLENDMEGSNVRLSLATYSSGVYFVKINTEDDFLVKQIIKQ